MSDSEMKANGLSQGSNRRWTDAEVRYLSAHRADGSYLIAHVLKRSPMSVMVKASRLHISLERKPMKVCPICGTYFVRDNKAGRYGMCQVCWERRKADAMRERAAERAAQRDYDNAKHRKNSGGA